MFLSLKHTDTRGASREYHLFIPAEYFRSTRRFPLLVYLHGISESEGFAVGPIARVRPLLEELGADHFPFFVLVPRCGAFPETWQAGGASAQSVLELVDLMCRQYRIDPDRVSLTGVSMGGFGTWSLAAEFPERWAAIAPICGGGDPSWATRLKALPCWCFHGAADAIVPVQFSRSMIAAIRSIGGSPRYSEYVGIGHNVWERVFRQPDLFEWLSRQSRIPVLAMGNE